MDCADRIAVLATERALEPIRGIARPDGPRSTTVRVLVARRRLDVTVRNAPPRDPDRSPSYGWEVCEVEADGAVTPAGLHLDSRWPSFDSGADPEDAYWLALEAARAAVEPG